MTQIKTRHHYLSRFYLEGFANNEGRVLMYKKEDPSNPSCAQPSNIAFENGLYHLEDNDQSNDINVVEDFLADGIEGPAVNAFKKLRNKQFPTNEEREKLSQFFGALMVRTPGYINHLKEQYTKEFQLILEISARDKDQFHQSLKSTGIDYDENEIEAERQSILAGNIQAVINKDYLLTAMLHLGSVLATHINNMRWALIETNDDYPFITSDNIINLFHPELSTTNFLKIGLGTSNAMLFIPVSKKSSLLMINNTQFINDQVFSIDVDRYDSSGNKVNIKELIKALNKTVFIKAYKFIFSSSDSPQLKRMFTNIINKSDMITTIKTNQKN